jgi:hypothetical protein
MKVLEHHPPPVSVQSPVHKVSLFIKFHYLLKDSGILTLLACLVRGGFNICLDINTTHISKDVVGKTIDLHAR